MHKHAEPRPVGRGFGRQCMGLGKFLVFETARSRSYKELLFAIFCYIALFPNARQITTGWP